MQQTDLSSGYLYSAMFLFSAKAAGFASVYFEVLPKRVSI
jgi:hypothetical protein